MSRQSSGPRPQDEMHVGRTGPTYAIVYDWVGLSDVSSEAAHLYGLLCMHINRQRGDSLVWPGTDVLARMLKRARGDKVTRWIRELVNLGAIEVERRGMPRKNVYTIHLMPPDGYAGPVTLDQWYDLHRDEIDVQRIDAKGKRDARREAAKPQVTAVTPETGELAVTPETGDQVTPTSGVPVTPQTGREPLRSEPLRSEPSTSSPQPTLTVVPPLGPEEEEGSENQEDPRAIAGRILDEVQSIGGAMRASRVRGREREQLVSAIADRLRAGWVAAHVTVALEGDLSSVKSVYGTLRYRVQERLAGAPPAAPAPKPTRATERCPTCAPYRPGWVDADPDRPARCPTCVSSQPAGRWTPGFLTAMAEAVSV